MKCSSPLYRKMPWYNVPDHYVTTGKNVPSSWRPFLIFDLVTTTPAYYVPDWTSLSYFL